MDKNRFHMNRSQRMQLKAFLCLLGFLLILILLAGRLIIAIFHGGEEELGKPIREILFPRIESLQNVWIMEENEEGILVFQDGERAFYEWAIIKRGQAHHIGDSGAEPPAEELRYHPEESVREQLADVTLTNGAVTDVAVKNEKINGRILSADENGVEIEGYGKLPLAADCKGYRLYDSLAMCTVRDICFGYDFTDLCIENGEICGILLVKEEAMDSIRVLIKETDPAGRFHTMPVITADTGFTVTYGAYDDRKTEVHQAGEEVSFTYDSPYFEGGNDRVWIAPDVLTGKVILKSGTRNQGTPAYRGRMEVLRTQDGLVVINEVLLEEYLYSVVPSEMPARYPGEALKAQAICARTYAYGHMEHAGYPQYGAHLDDSTTYQVYNNIKEQETTTTAVKETYGQLLYTDAGQLAETYYYSTSCGVGSDANVWKTAAAPLLTYLHAQPLSRTAMAQALTGQGAEGGGDLPEETPLGERLRDEEAFEAFITSKNEDDFEVNESWYRWTYEVEELDSDRLLELLQKRYAANSDHVLTLKDGEYVSRDIRGLGKVYDIYVESRGAGGTADELVIEAERGTYKVITGYNIRYILNNGEAPVVRQDGKEAAAPTLLPSSFFVITTGKKDGNVVGYTLTGGGFGHGVGMSQNGAKEMARAGWNAWDILTYFYEDCSTKCIYE